MNFSQKVIGAILGGCYGDVLGSQTEGMTRKNIIEKYGDIVLDMPTVKNYTDDSEMTLVLLRHIIKNKKILAVQLHIEYANELINNKGYSSTTRSTLQQIKDKNYPSEKGFSDHNGCIMRISPLGLIKFDNDQDLIDNIVLATYFTHGGHASSLACCFLHCKLINKLVFTENLTKEYLISYVLELSTSYQPLFTILNLVKYLLYTNNPSLDITHELFGIENFFQIKAIDCLATSLYIFFRFFDDPLKAVCYAASIGGDTDTIAKIVGDLMGALYGLKWVPASWEGIENEDEFKYLAGQLI